MLNNNLNVGCSSKIHIKYLFVFADCVQVAKVQLVTERAGYTTLAVVSPQSAVILKVKTVICEEIWPSIWQCFPVQEIRMHVRIVDWRRGESCDVILMGSGR